MKVPVWDLPTRVFHWSLVGLVALAWATSEGGNWVLDIHVWSGIAILGLVVFRLQWGVYGGLHARFGDFVRGWAAVRAYGARMLTRSAPRHLGHNPLGGWMILALLAALVAVVASSLMMVEDDYTGPWAAHLGYGVSRAMGEAHEGIAVLLGWLIGFHVLGVVAQKFISGENLIIPMWRGDKDVDNGEAAKRVAVHVGHWRAAAAFVVSGAALWAMLR